MKLIFIKLGLIGLLLSNYWYSKRVNQLSVEQLDHTLQEVWNICF